MPTFGEVLSPSIKIGGNHGKGGNKHCFSSVKWDTVAIRLFSSKFSKHKAIIFLHEFIFGFILYFIGPVLGKLERKNIVKKEVGGKKKRYKGGRGGGGDHIGGCL